MPQTPTKACQCEHADHFSGKGHPYGVQLPEKSIAEVKTISGTFEVCPCCLQTCYGINSGVRA